MKRSVAVIGGGVSGLAVAYELMHRAERLPHDLDLRCFEASDRAGGNIRSDRDQRFLFEWGANGFLDGASTTLTLVRRLGLEDRLLKARPTAERRFVFRKGKLRQVPTTPVAFLASGVLSPAAKLRVLLEPLVRARPASSAEESVYDFAARRVGRGAAAVLVDAMVSGIYAGDARRLSLPATLPQLHRMEVEHGGLVRALLATRRAGTANGGTAGPGGRLTSFRNGMQELTDALAAALDSRLSLRFRIERLSFLGNRGFRLHPQEGATFDVDAVVVCCPAWCAAGMFESMEPRIAGALADIPSAALAVVHLGYRRDAIAGLKDGFGFLVPRGQGLRILGTLWSSNIFEQRAPEGSALLTTMIGGAHDPHALELSDAKLLRIAREDLRRAMDVAADPYVVRIVRHPRGIPQYELGHLDRVAAIEERLPDLPGLWIAGNSLRGVAINACVEQAPGIAEATLEFLARPPVS